MTFKKSLLSTLTISLGIISITPALAKDAPKFVPANGKICSQVCSAEGMSALISGTYKNGKPFYVCATNAEGEGGRAGYNLEPSWSKACTVGWGGKEKSYTNYSCLCIKAKPITAEVSTFSGSGDNGKVNGNANTASFSDFRDLTQDSNGNFYLADYRNHSVRKIDASGTVTTFATNISYINGITIDSKNNLYVSQGEARLIKKITPAGVVSIFAGSGKAGSANGKGIAASFLVPYYLAVDSTDNIYVSDLDNHTIRKITPAGVVTTFAGSGNAGSADGTGTSASFNGPIGIAIDNSDNVYVADYASHLIRKITPSGVVTTIAGIKDRSGSIDGAGSIATFNIPFDLDVDSSGNIYVADKKNNKIRKIDTNNNVTTLAGNQNAAFLNGKGSIAKFRDPLGILVAQDGNIYVGDQGNRRIRKIELK